MLIFAPYRQTFGLALEFLFLSEEFSSSAPIEQAHPLFSPLRSNLGSGEHQDKGIWGFASEGDEDSRRKTP